MNGPGEICCFCGGEIIFRVIRGVTTPIHTSSSDCIGRRFYRRNQEGIPHYTRCPRCGSSVIFLRHNGGSLWLESLGWPWPKHPCFENDPIIRFPKLVLPEAAKLLKGGKLLFAHFLGRLSSGEGIAVFLGPTQRSLRSNPKYSPQRQWAVICDREQGEALSLKLEGTVLVASFQELRLITLDGAEFPIRQHSPVY